MSSPTPSAPDVPQAPSVGVEAPHVLLFGLTGAGKTALLAALMRAGEKQQATFGGRIVEASGQLARLAEAFYEGSEPPPAEQEVVSYVLRLESPATGQAERREDSLRSGFGHSPSRSIIIHDCSGEAASRCIEVMVAEEMTQLPRSSSGYRGVPRDTGYQDMSGIYLQALMAQEGRIFPDAPATGPLRLRQVLQEADALMVLVVATMDERKLRQSFSLFRQFLWALRWARSRARKVGGFPVFLVLTQCDRLARPGDSRAVWESRLQACSKHAYAAFAAFLRQASGPESPSPEIQPTARSQYAESTEASAEDGVEEWDAEKTSRSLFTPFGDLDLHVYTVAVRYPRHLEKREEATKPYRVVELFRDVFAAASGHRHRQQQADRCLRWTVRTVAAFFTAAMTTLLVLLFDPPRVPQPTLAEMVAGYREHEPPAEERLAASRIALHRQTLERFRDHADFWQLPAELQGFVLTRLREIEDYRQLRRRLAASLRPADCRTVSELEALEQSLQQGPLSIPPGRGYDWSATEAGRWRMKWLQDVQVIRQAEQQLQELYRDRIRRVQRLMEVDHFAGSWRDEATAVVQSPDPPYPLGNAVPGSMSLPDLPAEHGAPITWFVPYHFERVADWRDEWHRWRERLQALRDLADACGLTQGSGLPAPLRIPERSDISSSADDPALRWQQLQQYYAVYLSQPALWGAVRFPEPIRAILQDHRSRFLAGVGHRLRQELQRRVGREDGLADTPSQWRQVAELLHQPSGPLAEWGKLLHVLLLQEDSRAAEPLQELAMFLSRASFDLELQGVNLYLPPGLTLEPPRPAGPLLLKWTGPQGETVQRFLQMGMPIREGSGRLYIFQAEKVEKLRYRPGDTLTLELPLQAGQEVMRLVWERGVSASYQFDVLYASPRLLRRDGHMEVARGVRLVPLTGSLWPAPPPLWYALLNP